MPPTSTIHACRPLGNGVLPNRPLLVGLVSLQTHHAQCPIGLKDHRSDLVQRLVPMLADRLHDFFLGNAFRTQRGLQERAFVDEETGSACRNPAT